jgi:DNA-binding HxlR family transcriptional regulator
MALLDLLGRRWIMRVIWELRGTEPLNFRALQRRCDGMSSSVLNRRLAELRVAGIVQQAERGYAIRGWSPGRGSARLLAGSAAGCTS